MPLLTKTLGREYANELAVPNPPERDRYFRQLEQTLQEKIAEADAAKASRQNKVANNLPPMNGGRVRALVGFHMQQQNNTTLVDRLNTEIIHIRRWLFRQGAKLTPGGRIVWERSHARVVYDTQLQQQNFTKLTVNGGLLYQADGKPFDSTQMVTATMGPGWAIYVMSAEGHLHVSSHSVGHRHHSSLLAGAPVAGAGELRAARGRLMIISNKSGHYKPEPYFMLQVMDRLLAGGVSVLTQLLSFTPNAPPRLYPNYELFRREVAFPVIEEDALVFVDEPPAEEIRFVSVPGYPKD